MSEVNKAAETDKIDSDQAETTTIIQVKEKQPIIIVIHRLRCF